MQLTEILKQPDGFTPPDVTVTIEKVFAYKSGESENGPWSYQDVQVTGGKLKLKGLIEFPSTRIGQTVTIRANQSKQHGLTGMKVAHEEYQNKTYDKLVITNSAKWDWGNNGVVTQPESVANSNNGHATPTGDASAYAGHILACAELALRVSNIVMIDEHQAMQACFATICIDTKNRGLLLPEPTVVAEVPAAAPAAVEALVSDLEPDENPDVPF